MNKKKYKYSLIFIVICLSFSLISCRPKEEDIIKEIQLYPAYEWKDNKKLWGYINKKGDFEIPPKYNSASNFITGLSLVERDGLFGVIDSSGNLILNTIYRSIDRLDGNYFAAHTGKELKLFNSLGDEIITDRKYLSIESFSSDSFLVSIKDSDEEIKFGYINKEGREIISPKYNLAYGFVEDYAIVREDEYFQLINKKGKTKKYLDVKELFPSEEAKVFIYSEDNSNYGLMDHKGQIIVPSIYSEIKEVLGGHAVVKLLKDQKELCGLINLEASPIIEAKYRDIKILAPSIIAVSDSMGELGEEIYSIRDLDNKALSPEKFYKPSQFYKGFSSASSKEESFFINTKGQIEERLPIVQGHGEMTFDGGLIKAHIDGELIYFNKNKEIVWEALNIYRLGNNREVLENTFQEGPITIKYPLFVGYSNRQVQEDINKFIEDVFLVEELDEFNYLKTNYSLELQGQILNITKNSSFLIKDRLEKSVRKEFYNIDIDTGKVYTISDIVKEGCLDSLNERLSEGLRENSTGKNYHTLKAIAPSDGFKLTRDSLFIYMSHESIVEDLKEVELIELDLNLIDDLLDKDGNIVKNILGN